MDAVCLIAGFLFYELIFSFSGTFLVRPFQRLRVVHMPNDSSDSTPGTLETYEGEVEHEVYMVQGYHSLSHGVETCPQRRDGPCYTAWQVLSELACVM
jgi:hypothetical protein